MSRPDNSTRKSTRRFAAGLALAAAVAFGLAGEGLAQPGPHGGGDPTAIVAHMLQAAKARLNLNSSQLVAWDSAVAASQSAHQAIRANRQRLHQAASAELAKPQPDLGALAALSDDVAAQNRAAHVSARGAWLNLYASLSPDQKTIVGEMLAQRMARAEAFRDRFRQRLQPGSGG